MSSRDNADESYAAFMSMGPSEWLGLLGSLLNGGVLQPAEEEGFKRACRAREAARKAVE